MRPGTKPTSNSIKLLRGNPSGRPINDREPESAGPFGDAPTSWTPAQKLLWWEVVNAAPRNVLTKSDRIIVELVVRNLAQFRAATEITASMSAEMRRCLGELGMSPGERSRMVVAKEEEFNPFTELRDR